MFTFLLYNIPLLGVIMKILKREQFTIIAFSNADDEIKKAISGYPTKELVLVPLEGTGDKTLPLDRIITTKPESSFLNHMMWEGLLDEEEQVEYIIQCAEKFMKTGKQMIIEDYSFQADEPFYDYSN